MTMNQPLNDFLTITNRQNEKVELFMSAALVRTIVEMVGDQENFLNIYTDNKVQTIMLETVLVPRDAKGRPTVEDFTLTEVQIGASQQTAILQWVQEHVLNFFIESAETAKQSMLGTRFQRLTVLLNGSQDLQEPKQSAGPTDASTAA